MKFLERGWKTGTSAQVEKKNKESAGLFDIFASLSLKAQHEVLEKIAELKRDAANSDPIAVIKKARALIEEHARVAGTKKVTGKAGGTSRAETGNTSIREQLINALWLEQIEEELDRNPLQKSGHDTSSAGQSSEGHPPQKPRYKNRHRDTIRGL